MAFGFATASGELFSDSAPLVVAPFVPPVQKAPKEMPDISVKAAVEAQMENGKQLRIALAEPSQLRDLAEIRLELSRQEEAIGTGKAFDVADLAEENHRFLILGATVIDREISHVTWTDKSGNPMEALCGFDISLLEGFPGFSHAGTTYSLMLMHGQHVTSRDGGYRPKAFPDLLVKPGGILFRDAVAAEDDATAQDLEVMASLITNERERLVEFQRARARRAEAERQWREENPVPPKDESIWLRPHTGSRYLAEAGVAPTPETPAQGGGE